MEYKVILESVVGSTLHGTAVEDGLEDLDLMAVAIETQQTAMGLSYINADKAVVIGTKDTWTKRTKPEGVRSETGDVDWACYGLRKYLTLVSVKASPTAILPLFAPRYSLRVCESEGEELRSLVDSIISKRAYASYSGYMHQQAERLKGSRGQKNCTRPELVEAYGYDTKYASHIIRLGIQGVELLTNGKITLPMSHGDAELVRGIRNGMFSFEHVLAMAAETESMLALAHKRSQLREEPDYEKLTKWMLEKYLSFWKS